MSKPRIPVKDEVPILIRKHFAELNIVRYEPEYKFCFQRKWMFDWAIFSAPIFAAIAPVRLAVEIEGAVWTQGRHTRGSGFIKDMEKYNKAACLGWSILRFTPDQIRRGEDIPVIREWLANRA